MDEDGCAGTSPISLDALRRRLQSMEDLLMCPVCLERYKEPKSLSCLHALCCKCIQSMVDVERQRNSDRVGSQAASDAIMITCPACRQLSLVPGADSRNLPDNFMVNSMVEALCRSPSSSDDADGLDSGEYTLATGPESGVRTPAHGAATATTMRLLRSRADCGNCGESRRGASDVCRDCNLRLCRPCAGVHRRQLASRSHRVVPVEQLGDGERRALRVRPPPCACHAGAAQEFHCDTCGVMICRDCALFEHRQHDFVRAEELAERQSEQLVDCHDQLESLLLLIPECTAGVKQCMRVLSNDTSTARFEALKCMDKLMAILKKKRRMLEHDVVQQREARMLGYRENERALAEHGDLARDLLAVSSEVQSEQCSSGPWDRLALLKELQACNDKLGRALSEATQPPLDPATPHVELAFEQLAVSSEGLFLSSGRIVGRLDDSGAPTAAPAEARRYILKAPDVCHTEWTITLHIIDTRYAGSVAALATGDDDCDVASRLTAFMTPLGGGHGRSADGVDRERTGLHIVDRRNGTLVIRMNVEQAGHVQVDAKLDGEDVCGSPAVMEVVENGRTLRLIGGRGTGDYQFRDPYDVTVSEHNNHIFVADAGNHRVQELGEDGQYIRTIRHTADDGKAMKPTAVVATADGKLVVADYNHKNLLLFANGSVKVLRAPDFASNHQHRRGTSSSSSGGGGGARGSSPRGCRPLECYGLAVDAEGRILATDYMERCVLVFSPEGSYLAVFGYEGQLSGEARSESPQPVSPKGPLGVFASPATGNYYIADFGYYRVTVLNEAGDVQQLLAGRLDPGQQTESAAGGGGGGDETFKRPWGIWCDPASSLILVSDHTTHQVMVFEHGQVTGRMPIAADVAPRMNGPVGMAPDKYGRVWVVEREAHRIRLF